MAASIESFFTAHENTIAALGAISTFLAVVVSLVIARQSLRLSDTQLRASVSISTLVHERFNDREKPRYVTVFVTNTGNLPLRIPFSFFEMKAPFQKWMMLMNPLDYFGTDPNIPKVTYPFQIPPRSSHTFFVSDLKGFLEEMAYAKYGSSFPTKLMFRFTRVMIVSDDRKVFRARFSTPLRKELAKLEAKPRLKTA